MAWKEVTRAEPCPVCEKPGWCRRATDGTIHCHRIESSEPWTGPTAGGWIHKLAGQILAGQIPRICPGRKARLSIPELHQIAVEAFLHLNAGEIRQWLSEALSVSVATLVEFGVGWGWDSYRKADFATWPEKNARGWIVAIRRRYRDGTKLSMKGGSAGVYYARGWQHWDGGQGPILVPEGGSDTAALWFHGYAVVGRPSNTSSAYLADLFRGLNGRTIIIIGENDRKPAGRHKTCLADCKGCHFCWPGKSGAISVAQRLAIQLHRRIDWALPRGKDARAFFQQYPGARPEDLVDEFEEVGHVTP